MGNALALCMAVNVQRSPRKDVVQYERLLGLICSSLREPKGAQAALAKENPAHFGYKPVFVSFHIAAVQYRDFFGLAPTMWP